MTTKLHVSSGSTEDPKEPSTSRFYGMNWPPSQPYIDTPLNGYQFTTVAARYQVSRNFPLYF